MTFHTTLIRVSEVYAGSDGEATKALFAEIAALEHPGADIAINLFRAQKGSARAKVYRGGERGRGSYKRMAYERKAWSMDLLCAALEKHAAAAGIASWGWGTDEKRTYHRDVLYIDLPTGQASFHTEGRGAGPDYPGKWDGKKRASPGNIIRWIAILLDPPPPADLPEILAPEAGSPPPEPVAPMEQRDLFR